MSQLVWIFATCPTDKYRNGKRAVELARKLLKAAGHRPGGLYLLAVALAETGNFEEAARTAREGESPAATDGQKKPFRELLPLLEKKQPFREQRPADPAR